MVAPQQNAEHREQSSLLKISGALTRFNGESQRHFHFVTSATCGLEEISRSLMDFVRLIFVYSAGPRCEETPHYFVITLRGPLLPGDPVASRS